MRARNEKKKAESPRISFRLPQEKLQEIDALVKLKKFRDRSAFMRIAVERQLEHYEEYEHGTEEEI